MDRHQLSQVVRNLVSNAIKFSAEESSINISVDVISNEFAENELRVKSKIIFKKERAAHYVRFSVTDKGAGISKVSHSIF